MPISISGDGPITGITSLNTTVSSTELGYLDGTTSAIQTQLNTKPTGGTGAWIAWTPSFTNFTLGNGTVTARYSQIGSTVFISIFLTWGSTTSATASSMQISLPITASSLNLTNIGAGFLRDASAGTGVVGSMEFSSTTTAVFGHSGTGSNSTVTATAPFTWAVSDTIKMNGFYEAA